MREALTVLEEGRNIYRDRLKSESGHAIAANHLGVVQCQLRMFGPGITNMEIAIAYFDKSGQTERATASRQALAAFRRIAERSQR
jgi:hypothetical protein